MTVHRTAIVGALLLAVLAALPSVPGALASSPSSTDIHTAAGIVGGAVPMPSALQASWAARSGYEPTYAQEVTDARPDVSTVSVVLGFWPSSDAFFAPSKAPTAGLTDSAIAAQFGVDPATFNEVESYFQTEGLSIVHAQADRLSLTVAGPGSNVGQAFGTTIQSGTWQGRSVHYPTSPATLPAWFAPRVAAITGLSDGFTQFSFDLQPAAPPAPAQGRTSSYITPSAAHLLYGLSDLYNVSGTPHYAQGVGIAIVLWGDGYDPDDLTTFFSQYYAAGFPSISLYYDPIDGAPDPSASAMSDPSNSPQELTLDLEWAGSAAPGASLYAVYAPDGQASNDYSPSDSSLEDALNAAIDTAGVQVVSMSFGTPDGGDPALQAQFALSIARATQKGITVLAASGDNGGTSAANCGGVATPEFPASSPSVLAVGGTAPVENLDAFGDVTGLDSEPAWNGSGGGYSTDYAAPSWQANLSTGGHRGIPDVAGPAFDDAFYYGGAEKAGRGTSFATPMWAGLIAEMDAVLGRPLGEVTPRLYAIGTAEQQGETGVGLVDITSGSNCIGSAVPGWDDVTGWGTPRALQLVHDLSSSFVDVVLNTGSGSVAPGGTLDASVTVLNASDVHAPLAGVTVTFTLTQSGSIAGPCGGTLSALTSTTDSNGSATVPLGVPGCYLGSSALLTVVAASKGYYGSNSTTIAVNLLGIAGFLAVAQVFPYNVVLFTGIIAVALGIAYVWGERIRRRLAAERARRVRRSPRPTPPTAAPMAPPPAPPASPAPAAPVRPPVPAAAPLAPPAPADAALQPTSEAPPTVPDHVAEPPGTSPVPLPSEPSATPGDPKGSGGTVPSHVWGPPAAAISACPNCGGTLGVPGMPCPSCGVVTG